MSEQRSGKFEHHQLLKKEEEKINQRRTVSSVGFGLLLLLSVRACTNEQCLCSVNDMCAVPNWRCDALMHGMR